MTTHMENRKETVRPKLLLTPRRPTTIATWNVRTMYAGGKTVIVEEMRRYNLSVLGLGETRWLQTGQVNLASGESILYSTQMTLHHIQRE